MPYITTSYEIVTEESAEEGDVEERGWEDEEGEEIETDDDEESVVDAAVAWLKSHGAAEPSASRFHVGVWYSTEPDQDISSGDETTLSFHLHDFTPEDEREIFDKMRGR